MFIPAIRVLLVAGALLTIIFMLMRIRRSKVQIKDSIFWIIFSVILLVISIFPRIVEWISNQLGFQAPINLVYLIIIFVLLIKLFSNSVRISLLDARQQELVQRLALTEKEQEDTARAMKAKEGAQENAAKDAPEAE